MFKVDLLKGQSRIVFSYSIKAISFGKRDLPRLISLPLIELSRWFAGSFAW